MNVCLKEKEDGKMIKKVILITILITLLFSPVSAKVVTAKVDDKGLIGYGNSAAIEGTLHTEYGTILVREQDYNRVQINDTIRYETDMNQFWHRYWDIEVIE